MTHASYVSRPLTEGVEVGFIGVEPELVPFEVGQEELRATYPLQVVLSEDVLKVCDGVWSDVAEVTEVLGPIVSCSWRFLPVGIPIFWGA